ncbi:MAG: FmdE family protein [Methanosarcinales archaeon]|nr:FmdE family protein [Methanosarcinales archaeon]
MEMTKDEMLELGFKFHGHRCPGMPLGLRVAWAAMEKLGVSRAEDGEVVALIETGDAHCAGCFGDGVQVASGCTLGKGNIKKTYYGKIAVTLISRKNNRAVRAYALPGFFAQMEQSPSMQQRNSDVPASRISTDISQPSIDMVMSMPDSAFIGVSDVFDYEMESPVVQFKRVRCNKCGDMVIEKYAHVMDDEIVCQPCLEKVHTLQVHIAPQHLF